MPLAFTQSNIGFKMKIYSNRNHILSKFVTIRNLRVDICLMFLSCMLGQNYATIAIADLYIFLTDNIRWRVENNANMRSEFSRKSISFDSQPMLNWHIIHQIPLTIHKAFPFIEQAMSIKSKIVTIIGHLRPPTDANKTEITPEVALLGGGLHEM